MALHKGLKDYAIISATHDFRFNPMELSEVSHLEVSVSLMHSFEECSKWDDWEVRIFFNLIFYLVF